MPLNIARLLKTYEFLQTSLSDHRHQMAAVQVAEFERKLDRIFVEIVRYSSREPRVTIAQLRFLMMQLVSLAGSAERASALRTVCQQHLDQLAAMLAPDPPPPACHPTYQHAYLDSLRDRVALIDRDYRYQFTNRANADYHHQAQENFVGRPNWLMVSDAYFAGVTKPRFDACFVGESSSFISAHQAMTPRKLFAVNVDPVRDATGEINAIMVSCRDITGLDVPEELIIPLE